MSTLFTPFFQPADINGKPLAGAKLYFYQTGTSTLLNTYTTSALTTPNTNPVSADSAGRFGPVYLGTSSDYKVILQDSTGTTIATADPVFAGATSGRTTVNDINYTAVVSDRLIAFTTLTASRIVTLPPAANFPAGTLLVIVDETGSAGAGKTLSAAPNGSDLIDGANSSRIVVRSAYGAASIESNGLTKWTVVSDDHVPVVRSWLAGLGTSNDGVTPNTKLDVAAGQCADDTNTLMMTVAAGTIDCGTVGANGLDAGVLANSTWYHVFAIAKTDGTTALLASTSVSAPTYPAGYTLKRRIGSFKTDGIAHILAFTQDGDYFRWSASVLDINATNPGTAAVTATLSVPTGVNVQWFGNVNIAVASTATSIYVSDLAANDEAPITATTSTLAVPGSMVVNWQGGTTPGSSLQVRTNTSAQVRYRLSASAADVKVGMVTLGWIDRLGKYS